MMGSKELTHWTSETVSECSGIAGLTIGTQVWKRPKAVRFIKSGLARSFKRKNVNIDAKNSVKNIH
jgi:hypothetical protein